MYIQIGIMLWIKCTTCLLDEYTLNWADCYFIPNDVGVVSADFPIIVKTPVNVLAGQLKIKMGPHHVQGATTLKPPICGLFLAMIAF